jgi:hypothetical protein
MKANASDGVRAGIGVIDLAKPYRDLLVGQTSPVVRGVVLYAIASMDKLQRPSAAERALMGDKFEKQLAAVQLRQETYSPKDTALSAIILAVNSIVLESAAKVFVGEDMVIRGISGSAELKKAAMCYALGHLMLLTLIAAFIQAGVVSSDDKEFTSGEWKVSLLACFPLASPEQKAEIVRLGLQMFNDLRERRESNVKEFIETLEQLTVVAAINWEGNKVSEDEILGLFKQKAEVLLGALDLTT